MAAKGVIVNPVLGAVVLSKGIVGLAGIRIDACAIALICGANSTPPSNLTAFALPSFIRRPAFTLSLIHILRVASN